MKKTVGRRRIRRCLFVDLGQGHADLSSRPGADQPAAQSKKRHTKPSRAVARRGTRGRFDYLAAIQELLNVPVKGANGAVAHTAAVYPHTYPYSALRCVQVVTAYSGGSAEYAPCRGSRLQAVNACFEAWASYSRQIRECRLSTQPSRSRGGLRTTGAGQLEPKVMTVPKYSLAPNRAQIWRRLHSRATRGGSCGTAIPSSRKGADRPTAAISGVIKHRCWIG